VRQQPAVEEHAVPTPVPSVMTNFEAGAVDHCAALHVGVVGHLHRHLERVGERGGEVEAAPLRAELRILLTAVDVPRQARHMDDHPVAHHPGEPDAHAVVAGERRQQRGQRLDQHRRRAGVGRLDPQPLGDHLAHLVEHGPLEAGAADVDRERVHVRGPRRLLALRHHRLLGRPRP
jgi:hypothetical protein